MPAVKQTWLKRNWLLLGLPAAPFPLVFYHAWQLPVADFVKSSRLVRITESR